jgi:hypothetical protein
VLMQVWPATWTSARRRLCEWTPGSLDWSAGAGRNTD